MNKAPTRQNKRATYPGYKPSEMDWVGDIPQHWQVHRLKHVALVQFSSVDKHTVDGEDPVRLCNYVDVYYNDFIRGGLDFMAATAKRSEIERFQLRQGDVLITKDLEVWDDIALPEYLAEDLDGVLCGYYLAHIRPSLQKMQSEYLFPAFRSHGVNDQCWGAANGITRFGLGKYWLDNGLFLVPLLDEQKAIAVFLDRETALIDALIEKRRCQIELLHEKRAALISYAVTKGIDPSAPMKDSGVEWLGEVPEHWDGKGIKNLRSECKGAVKTGPFGSQLHSSEMTGGEIKVFNQRTVIDRGITSGENYISMDKFNQLIAFEVFIGDLLVTTRCTIARCMIVPESAEKGILHPCHMRLQLDENLAYDRYIEILIQESGLVLNQLQIMSNSTTMEVIYSESLKEVFLPIPPVDEQCAIAAFLDRETAGIDGLAEKVELSIDRLREETS